MQSLKNNKIFWSVCILVILGCIYYFFFAGSGNTTTTTPFSGPTTPGQTAGSDILAMLARMNSVQIDTSLFTTPAWTSLVNVSAPLPTFPPGKSNLFGSIGGQANTPAVTQTKNAGASAKK